MWRGVTWRDCCDVNFVSLSRMVFLKQDRKIIVCRDMTWRDWSISTLCGKLWSNPTIQQEDHCVSRHDVTWLIDFYPGQKGSDRFLPIRLIWLDWFRILIQFGQYARGGWFHCRLMCSIFWLYKCSKCDKSFFTFETFRGHMSTRQLLLFICSVCTMLTESGSVSWKAYRHTPVPHEL
jgi:hypothetical protein